MADYQVTWIGCAAENFEQGRRGQQIAALAFHEMEGTLAGTDSYFLRPRPNAPSSAHYGVGADGTIHQYVADGDTAYSNGIVRSPNIAAVPWLGDLQGVNPNTLTLSIELEGHHQWRNNVVGGVVEAWWQPTEAQYQAALWLARRLVAAHGIAIDRAHITRHSDYDSIKKGWCPGLGWPMQRLLDDLQASARAYTVQGPPTISLAVFANWLQQHHSPAFDERPASEYYDACVKAGIDPNFALAQFWHESQCGTDGIAKETKGWGNLRRSRGHASGSVAGPFAKYDSWLLGLADWITLWITPPYKDMEMRAALERYAPSSDGNNPDGYWRAVQLFMAARAEASKQAG